MKEMKEEVHAGKETERGNGAVTTLDVKVLLLLLPPIRPEAV